MLFACQLSLAFWDDIVLRTPSPTYASEWYWKSKYRKWNKQSIFYRTAGARRRRRHSINLWFRKAKASIKNRKKILKKKLNIEAKTQQQNRMHCFTLKSSTIFPAHKKQQQNNTKPIYVTIHGRRIQASRLEFNSMNLTFFGPVPVIVFCSALHFASFGPQGARKINFPIKL